MSTTDQLNLSAMHIVILTQYFPPETGAPQNRLFSLATHLAASGAKVSVITAIPSYPVSKVYPGYEGKGYMKEQMQDIDIYRCPIFVTKSKGVFKRLLNYFSFMITALIPGLFWVRKPDCLICESPPLFLGITARMITILRGNKLVFNVSDLWPKSAVELGIVTNPLMLNLSYRLERYIYRHADLVSGQTQGIMDDIHDRFPNVSLHLLRNGIDRDQFARPGNREKFRSLLHISNTSFVVAYAGIIGHAQGFEVVLNAAHQLRHEKNIIFLLVGDGPVKSQLVSKAAEMKLHNIIFSPSVSREEIPDVVAACDCYVTPLRNQPVFLGAIPSKIFEPLYYGKPVIMGVNGEAKALFVDQGKCALHFEPENAEELSARILQLHHDPLLLKQLGENGKEYVSREFDRKQLALQFWQRIQEL